MRQRRNGSSGRTKGRANRYLSRHPAARLWSKALLAETKRQTAFHNIMCASLGIPVIT